MKEVGEVLHQRIQNPEEAFLYKGEKSMDVCEGKRKDVDSATGCNKRVARMYAGVAIPGCSKGWEKNVVVGASSTIEADGCDLFI